MKGIASQAASLAGDLHLDRLIVLAPAARTTATPGRVVPIGSTGEAGR
jgi:hypothetical protein